MGLGKKPDFPPLLGPGRHSMTLMAVKELCVDAFRENSRRKQLFYRLEAYIQDYLVSGMVCEIWVNGSFLTSKPEPSDVDVTTIVSAEISATLSPDQWDLINQTNDIHYGPDVDAFAWIWLPKEHPDYFDEQLNPALTWHQQYGVENSSEWLKGFAVIKLRENNV